jgi:triosephosphate isomerase
MNRKPFVAGNWKMQKTIDQALELVDALLPDLMKIEAVDRVLCPPFTALEAVNDRLSGSGVALGAQNVYWQEEGAYTGEISPLMLRGLCDYVIIGHSERRAYFHETDETVNRRVRAAQAHDLVPILCIGETLEQREAGETEQVVARMMHGGLQGVKFGSPGELVVAYEPVWAIGTGKAATPGDAEQVVEQVVRSSLAELLGKTFSDQVRVLYGGSVKPDNAQSFFECPSIDGALVGGASLRAESFSEIVRIAAASSA